MEQLTIDFEVNDLPVSTAQQSRLQLFEPKVRMSRKKNEALPSRTFTAPQGTVTVTGFLGQNHATFIEACIYTAIDKRHFENGALGLLVDPYKLKKVMANYVSNKKTKSGDKKVAEYNNNQALALAKDLIAAHVDMTVKIGDREVRVLGHLLDEVIMTTAATAENPLTGGFRSLWRVTLSASFMALINNDISLFYDPYPISKLTTGVAQAVTRWIKTHKSAPNGGWKMNTVLEAVGIDTGNKDEVFKRRTELFKDAEQLKNCGIRLQKANGRVTPYNDHRVFLD